MSECRVLELLFGQMMAATGNAVASYRLTNESKWDESTGETRDSISHQVICSTTEDLMTAGSPIRPKSRGASHYGENPDVGLLVKGIPSLE